MRLIVSNFITSAAVGICCAIVTSFMLNWNTQSLSAAGMQRIENDGGRSYIVLRHIGFELVQAGRIEPSAFDETVTTPPTWSKVRRDASSPRKYFAEQAVGYPAKAFAWYANVDSQDRIEIDGGIVGHGVTFPSLLDVGFETPVIAARPLVGGLVINSACFAFAFVAIAWATRLAIGNYYGMCGRCRHCGYRLIGNEGRRCPECGNAGRSIAGRLRANLRP